MRLEQDQPPRFFSATMGGKKFNFQHCIILVLVMLLQSERVVDVARPMRWEIVKIQSGKRCRMSKRTRFNMMHLKSETESELFPARIASPQVVI